jgi:anaerobic magnesium-protoporphyrin IX monomethyl ester cyclase
LKVLLGSVGGGIGLGLLYLASYARKFGSKEFEFKVSDSVALDVINFQPDFVGLYCATRYADDLPELCRLVKARCKAQIVVGGHHVSAMEGAVIDQNIDYVVVGEGERAFLDILEGKTVRGYVKRDPLENLDTIPFPARDLVNIKKSDWVYMSTSRGCPYKCVYCAPQKFWGKPRYRSSSDVVAEIQYLTNEGYKRICFGDDLFIGDLARLQNIVALLKYHNLKGVEFACTVRANLVSFELCRLLYSINVTRVSFGVESGCEKTLKYLKCGSVSLQDNLNVVHFMKNYFNFVVNGSFIVGAPDETFVDALETLKFVAEYPLDGVDLFTFTPYPGTQCFSNVGCYSWSSYDVYRRKMIFGGAMSDVELQEIYRRFDQLKHRKTWRYMLKRGLANPARIKYLLNGRLGKQK